MCRNRPASLSRVTPTTSVITAALAIVLLAPAVPADAKRSPCRDSSFVSPTALFPGTGSARGAFDRITLSNGRITIDSGCGPARVRLRRVHNLMTIVRARWKRCGELRRVRLSADITTHDGSCDQLQGGLTARGKVLTRFFTAGRSRCGDSIVDTAAGESCDPPGFGCSAECKLDDTPPPRDEWTWMPFDDAYCANGTTTGIGVSPGAPGGRLVIFLMGGGACWDAFTCYTVGTADNLSGYGAASFASDANSLLKTSLFDRTDETNPFRNDSFVFVPYCTGDVHAGSNPNAVWDGQPTKHVGFQNMTAFLPKIVETFPTPSRVLLAGASAGGFGALINWWRTQEAFGDVRVDLLDDSGPTLPPPYTSEGLEQAWRAAWNVGASMPPSCTACTEDLHALVPFYGTVFEGHRAALLSNTQDGVIGYFFEQSGSGVEAGLDALAGLMAPYDLWRHFFVTGGGHVLLFTPDITQNGVSLRTFLTQMMTDDPAWSSVAPR